MGKFLQQAIQSKQRVDAHTKEVQRVLAANHATLEAGIKREALRFKDAVAQVTKILDELQAETGISLVAAENDKGFRASYLQDIEGLRYPPTSNQITNPQHSTTVYLGDHYDENVDYPSAAIIVTVGIASSHDWANLQKLAEDDIRTVMTVQVCCGYNHDTGYLKASESLVLVAPVDPFRVDPEEVMEAISAAESIALKFNSVFEASMPKIEEDEGLPNARRAFVQAMQAAYAILGEFKDQPFTTIAQGEAACSTTS